MVDSLVPLASDFDECPYTDPKLPLPKLQQIEAAAQMFATDEEIAAHVGISVYQLSEFYRSHVERGFAAGRLWLRQKIFDLAKSGDAEAQKMLAKAYLGTET